MFMHQRLLYAASNRMPSFASTAQPSWQGQVAFGAICRVHLRFSSSTLHAAAAMYVGKRSMTSRIGFATSCSKCSADSLHSVQSGVQRGEEKKNKKPSDTVSKDQAAAAGHCRCSPAPSRPTGAPSQTAAHTHACACKSTAPGPRLPPHLVIQSAQLQHR